MSAGIRVENDWDMCCLRAIRPATDNRCERTLANERVEHLDSIFSKRGGIVHGFYTKYDKDFALFRAS